jgi:hypothetical protein
LVLALLFEKLSDFLKDLDFPDVEKALAFRELDVKYTLTNNWVVQVRESYETEAYELRVDDVYLLMDAIGAHILTCDNAPHHPQMRTFPHHKHRYPKDRFKPTEFSGRFEDFLDEVLWEISRAQ